MSCFLSFLLQWLEGLASWVLLFFCFWLLRVVVLRENLKIVPKFYRYFKKGRKINNIKSGSKFFKYISTRSFSEGMPYADWFLTCFFFSFHNDQNALFLKRGPAFFKSVFIYFQFICSEIHHWQWLLVVGSFWMSPAAANLLKKLKKQTWKPWPSF